MKGFRKYILLRFLSMVFVVFCILTIIFAMFKVLPGDPTSIFVDARFPEEMITQQKDLWGLNDPLSIQYLRYLKNMATFDFGSAFFPPIPFCPTLPRWGWSFGDNSNAECRLRIAE